MARTWGTARAIVRVVHNGSNHAYKPLAGEEIQAVRNRYTDGKPYFLYVGSLHPRKNVDNLFKAYQRFCEETGRDIRMVIVGEKMWKNNRNTHPGGDPVDAGDYHDVIYTGRLEPSELRLVMGSALALTFVPWYEGFGIPVIEAMSAGIPVLTSNVTSLPEVGGDAVLYADPSSTESICNGMVTLASDENLRKELIKKGFERTRIFTWDKTARKVWLAIDTVIRAIQYY